MRTQKLLISKGGLFGLKRAYFGAPPAGTKRSSPLSGLVLEVLSAC